MLNLIWVWKALDGRMDGRDVTTTRKGFGGVCFEGRRGPECQACGRTKLIIVWDINAELRVF